MQYRVLKEDDLFILTEKNGNISDAAHSELGLYTRDTRFLSTYEFFIEGIELLLLSSTADQSYVGNIRLTNKEVLDGEHVHIWRESIGIKRKRFLYQGVFYERITLENHNTHSIRIKPCLRVAADFQDMFVIRGYQDGSRGEMLTSEVYESGLLLRYRGSDEIERKTWIQFGPSPAQISDDGLISYVCELEAGSSCTLDITVSPLIEQQGSDIHPYDTALHSLQASYQQWLDKSTRVESDSELFNDLYRRSLQDIRSLLTDLGEGKFPVAGIPWFAVPFGRDSLIAALQMLSVHPDIAKGTIKTLARYQGKNVDPWRDEQPGKILHEIRFGELANNNDIPHTPYFGTVDATPLFLVLVAEYYRWTGDRVLIETLLPNIKAALSWIDEYGDRDQDGYVEYFQESSKGIANQGWKDSADSVIHRDGSFAQAPIALSEVQGYVYDAKRKLSQLFKELGDLELSERLHRQAEELKAKFATDFWMEDEQFVAIAIDREKKKVESVTTDPGHCLWSDLLTGDQAGKVVQRLVAPDMFTGYGIRTMSATSTRYNPMSYHDGSIWPHDNSLVFWGMKKQGYGAEAMKVIQGLLDAARHFEHYRLPELFCGYSQEEEPYPVEYPVACSPQAWAAGSVFLMLQAMLGMEADVPNGQVLLSPDLPLSITRLKVEGLVVGEGELDLLLQKQQNGKVDIQVLRNSTGLKVSIR